MLKLLLGIDWKANRDAVLHEIAKDVAGQQCNRVLLVPELISHDMERRLCSTCGDTASRFAEVLSFSRLVSRVSDDIGRRVGACMDDGGRVVAMAAAVQQAQSRLKAYASVGTRPEFFTGLVEAIDEFKRCCISPDMLRNAAKKSEGFFAQKLEELSLIYECYNSVCHCGKLDPRDQMTWLLDELENCDYAEKHTFYIDGFPDFTRQNMAILEHLIRNAPNVTISLNTDVANSTHMAFEKAGSTANELIQLAKRNFIDVEIVHIPAAETPLVSVCKGLFQGTANACYENIKLYRSESLYHECIGTAERILSLVQNGARYRQISVVCADMPSYRNTIQMVFERCNIPAYISGTEEILEKSVIATVLAAIDTAISDFDQKDVLRYLRTSLSPLDITTCDELESYVVLWGISGKKWLEEWKGHPVGLREEWTESDVLLLSRLNAAREKALMPLVSLRKGLKEAAKLSEQVLALYSFFETIELPLHMHDLAEEMDAVNNNRDAQILNQLWDILIGALEQLYDVLGDTAWSIEGFTRLFKLLLSQYSVGTIPPVLDAITVGPVNAMRCQECEHLFVLGAAEGAMPGYSGSSGVLTDQERIQLRTMGVPLSGGSIDGLQNEFAEIYGVFCGANSSISVSCPAGQPSFVYQRLLKFGEERQEKATLVGAALVNKEDAAALLLQTNTESEVAKELGVEREFSAMKNKRSHAMGKIECSNVKALYRGKLRLSASQVDKYADCRLSYFLRYGVGAKEWKSITVDPAEFGTYVHDVLENTVKDVMALGGFSAVSLEQTLDIAKQYSDAYVKKQFSELETERLTYLFSRNGKELSMIVEELWSELRQSKFEPVFMELRFGDDGALPAISIPDAAIDAQVRGVVDRVDAWTDGSKKYIRVVDYKTGSKDFDYCDVFNGLGLQMLLYLFALENGGQEIVGANLEPAGVQYFPARAPLLSVSGLLTDEEAAAERKSAWKRKGLLLSDEHVLQAMEPGEKPIRLPYNKKKDGSISGDIADKQQLGKLKKFVFNLLGKMVDEIASGCVEANPYTRGENHNACKYCPYGAVCHVADVEGRRNYKKIAAKQFWEDIEKEVSNNG